MALLCRQVQSYLHRSEPPDLKASPVLLCSVLLARLHPNHLLMLWMRSVSFEEPQFRPSQTSGMVCHVHSLGIYLRLSVVLAPRKRIGHCSAIYKLSILDTKLLVY